jgi:hypothetical protein
LIDYLEMTKKIFDIWEPKQEKYNNIGIKTPLRQGSCRIEGGDNGLSKWIQRSSSEKDA